MKHIPVTVCIPTYNGATYLRECLESILAQTFQDFEVLIVDDQSTDRTFQIAQTYATSDPRIRVVRNKDNLGLPGNWNQCALLAHGEWIKFLFQDDILEADCLERMLTVCGPNTSMVTCKRKIIFEDDSKDMQDDFLRRIEKYDMDRIFCGEMEIPPESFCNAVLENWLGNFVGEPSAVLLHRSVFNRFGFFNSHLIQICDFEYWIRVASNTGLVYIPEFLAGFRWHSKGTTRVNLNSRKFRMHLDELVCNHDFIFHPLYRQLRFYALQHQPPYNLNQWFALRVRNSYEYARQASKEPSNPDPSLLEEMAEITQFFPGFSTVRKIPFSLRFDQYRWEIQNFLSNHLYLKKSTAPEND